MDMTVFIMASLVLKFEQFCKVDSRFFIMYRILIAEKVDVEGGEFALVTLA